MALRPSLSRVPNGQRTWCLIRLRSPARRWQRIRLACTIAAICCILAAAAKSAQKAMAEAGVTPEDIDLFELHDSFTVMAALSLEAAGFAERGRGLEAGA